VNLSESSNEEIAEMVDQLNDQISRLKEERSILMRELAKRMDGKQRQLAGDFQLSYSPWVNVSLSDAGRERRRKAIVEAL